MLSSLGADYWLGKMRVLDNTKRYSQWFFFRIAIFMRQELDIFEHVRLNDHTFFFGNMVSTTSKLEFLCFFFMRVSSWRTYELRNGFVTIMWCFICWCGFGILVRLIFFNRVNLGCGFVWSTTTSCTIYILKQTHFLKHDFRIWVFLVLLSATATAYVLMRRMPLAAAAALGRQDVLGCFVMCCQTKIFAKPKTKQITYGQRVSFNTILNIPGRMSIV